VSAILRRTRPSISSSVRPAASCLWVIYVYGYQIAVGWPALGASGELSLGELISDGAFIGHWFYLLSAAALGGALGVAFDDTPQGPLEISKTPY
jgi:hypothetical protein